eukprot:gb/GEZN01007618.1/.p1 GENE.gb/GEZN01007618.1/~~gb/GEZN01007618.1/.p1  ORF type:complete len:436 (-),score=36.65 gb/GEZN01007618.1/:94-1401(-)
MSSAASKVQVSAEKKIWNLAKESELRIEVDAENAIEVSIRQNGTAEMFGTELAPEVIYKFTDAKLAFFTWSGCTLEVKGTPLVAYTAEETPMVTYVNTHAALDSLRLAAKKKKGAGPKTMVVGPCDSGKSTLCRLLLSYAVRNGWRPTFADLDVGQNDLTIEGGMAATPLSHPFGIEDQSSLSLKNPIVFFFGHNSPSFNTDLYKRYVSLLADANDKRFALNTPARQSGIVINTPGWVDGEGYEILLHVAKAFSIDVILVVGHERLYSQLKEEKCLREGKENGPVTICKLGKSGGVVRRDQLSRRNLRYRSIKSYFYGPHGDLSPAQTVLSFHEIFIYKVGGINAAPDSSLPIGTKRLVDPNQLVKVDITQQLQQCILAVSHSRDYKDLLTTNIAGFIHVSKVDMKAQTVTCLTPCPGPLPSHLLIQGSIKWLDH